jgi:integrase
MAREIHRLTDPVIRSLKPGAKDAFHADGNNLFLRLRTSGARTWILRRKVEGKQIVTTLGSYPAISLRDARDHAQREIATRGPVATATKSVRDAVTEFLSQLRWKKLGNARTYGNVIANAIGSKRVRDVGRGDVLRLIEHYRVGRPVAGNRLLAFARMFFEWCVDRGFCDASPAGHLKRKKHGSREESRGRILSDEEIRAVAKLEGRHADLLKFLLHTPCRIAEAQGLDWSEIRGTRWTIPKGRTKSGREHWYELTPAAIALLGPPASAGRAFRHQTSATAVQAWVARWQGHAEGAWTPHDLRRTARTHATGRLGARSEVAEKWLGHRLEGLLAVYDVSEFEPERVALSADWAREIARIKSGRKRAGS